MPGPFVPTIDVLSGGFIADGRLCDAILEKYSITACLKRISCVI